MPFPVELKYIEALEADLQLKFPEKFKQRMQLNNGGELDSEEFEFELYPFWDRKDRKRISRTCNHIGSETQGARQWPGFPPTAVAIGGDGFGNQLVLLVKGGAGLLSEELFIWDHESGELRKIADSIEAIESER